MSHKYVVRGAYVKCNLGSTPSRLNLPRSHGVYINERPVMVDSDSAAYVNVMPFGECAAKEKCTPELAPLWDTAKGDALINGRPALITISVLDCRAGGTVEIKTDGQHE